MGSKTEADERERGELLRSPAAETRIWPSSDYLAQIAKLRAAVGQIVFLAESRLPESPDGFRITDTPVELVGVADFPRPDPARGILPHLVLLGDGRGVNLGRIARISITRAFNPTPEQLLYQQPMLLRQALFGERRLSPQSIAQRSKAMLGQLLGYTPETALHKSADKIAEPSEPER